MSNKYHYHFIGIGGIGMSGIALALIKTGFTISGSDIIANEQTKNLSKLGAIIFNSQKPNNIDVVINKFSNKKIFIVISSAIQKNNIELNYCIKKKINIKHRSEVLALIMQNYHSIAVAGTHGKTSTSTFLTTLLDLSTKNVSSIIGGIVPIYDSNSYIKDTKYLVAEIDESDGSAINYKSTLGIINNIDFDHCDYYENINELILSFKKFASNSKELLMNYDCKITRNNIKNDYQWSIKEINKIDYAMIPKIQNELFTVAKYYEKGIYIDTLNIPIPGLHNLSNITAAIAACRINNIDFKKIKEQISFLKLPKKRFEYRGNICNRTIIDDYAHHPREIKETLKLGKLFINKNEKERRLLAIFQPHRYTRVEKFFKEFAEELSLADLIIITNIYSAGERNINKISSKIISKEILKNNKNVILLKDNYEIKKNFFKLTKENDFIVNMGAGDCHNLWSILRENNISI